ncbi:PD-(D/E)XK nuclease superfamily protein [uncultured Helicobacter sp.]|uniref:PD-(D/E)XK nuclease superfamily protein n=1 Tax=uncultured Helicobacter sp. TaxID=175537 RepID=UPI00374E5EB1
MIANGIGGANTKTGLIFEGRVDLATFLSQQNGYAVSDDGEVFYQNELIAQIFKKYKFYDFLKLRGVDWQSIISKRLLPDDSIYVIINNTFFIIECKFQSVAGSVDEKLQTCDFKKKQYQRLLFGLNMEVEYIYLLSDWFKKPQYKDVLDYIISVGCRYYFEYIPLQVLGLPIPKGTK